MTTMGNIADTLKYMTPASTTVGTSIIDIFATDAGVVLAYCLSTAPATASKYAPGAIMMALGSVGPYKNAVASLTAAATWVAIASTN